MVSKEDKKKKQQQQQIEDMSERWHKSERYCTSASCCVEYKQ